MLNILVKVIHNHFIINTILLNVCILLKLYINCPNSPFYVLSQVLSGGIALLLIYPLPLLYIYCANLLYRNSLWLFRHYQILMMDSNILLSYCLSHSSSFFSISI